MSKVIESQTEKNFLSYNATLVYDPDIDHELNLRYGRNQKNHFKMIREGKLKSVNHLHSNWNIFLYMNAIALQICVNIMLELRIEKNTIDYELEDNNPP